MIFTFYNYFHQQGQMSAQVVSKTCNFNCTCTRPDCSFNHHISDLEERTQMKALWDELYDKTAHNETDPEGVRKVVCNFGLLCNKDGCNFKHYCNFTGRQVITRAWKKDHRATEGAKLVEDIKGKISADELERLMKLLNIRKEKV